MAESHVVSSLVAKHSELAGIIQFHRPEIECVAGGLLRLEATIKLFASEADLRSLGAKRVTRSRILKEKRAISCSWTGANLHVAITHVLHGVANE